MVGLAVLTILACCIAAFAFVKMQDHQAESLQGLASGALTPSSYSPSVFGSSESDPLESADRAARAAEEAIAAADQAAASFNAAEAAAEAEAAADAAAASGNE